MTIPALKIHARGAPGVLSDTTEPSGRGACCVAEHVYSTGWERRGEKVVTGLWILDGSFDGR
jgi:hypothetical protein